MTTKRWHTLVPLRNLSSLAQPAAVLLILVTLVIVYCCLRQTPDHLLLLKDPQPSAVEVLWYTKLEQGEESTGFIQESLNFMIPLFSLLSFGWYAGCTISDVKTNSFFTELSSSDQKIMLELFMKGTKINHEFPLQNNVIAITFDQPSQYQDIFENTRMKHAIYKVGRAMFETDWLPNNWEYQINEYLDELWVPSEFARDIFKSAGVYKPIKVIREGFDPTVFPENYNITLKAENRKILYPKCKDTDVIFLAVGKMERRKGVDILVNTFTKTFKQFEQACLYIRASMTNSQKASVLGLNTKGFRIFELPRQSNEGLITCYQTADVFVLPSHGEGWGRPIMEAMAAGVPAIVPLWSGITEFVSADYSLPLDVNVLEPAFAGEQWAIGGKRYQPLHHWAAINTTQLSQLLVWCLKNQPELAEIGARGRAAMFGSFTRDAISRDVAVRVDEIKREIAAGKGVEGWRRESEMRNRVREKERARHSENRPRSAIEGNSISKLDSEIKKVGNAVNDVNTKVGDVSKMLLRKMYLQKDENRQQGAGDKKEENRQGAVDKKEENRQGEWNWEKKEKLSWSEIMDHAVSYDENVKNIKVFPKKSSSTLTDPE